MSNTIIMAGILAVMANQQDGRQAIALYVLSILCAVLAVADLFFPIFN